MILRFGISPLEEILVVLLLEDGHADALDTEADFSEETRARGADEGSELRDVVDALLPAIEAGLVLGVFTQIVNL